MNEWNIYPAIDLRRGHVVRLRQGDPNAETRYADDPVAVAERWRDAGAQWIHIVNLDGAFGEGGSENVTVLKHLTTLGIQIQFGGGMRTMDTIAYALETIGVTRVVLGTVAVKQPSLLEQVLARFGPERIVLGIDARDGLVRTHGWQETAPISAIELGQHWVARGIRHIVFTDISRDGMETGLNLNATVELAQRTGAAVIASGGVSTLEEIQQAYLAGLSGVIIGRALYEGTIQLEEALRIGKDKRRNI